MARGAVQVAAAEEYCAEFARGVAKGRGGSSGAAERQAVYLALLTVYLRPAEEHAPNIEAAMRVLNGTNGHQPMARGLLDPSEVLALL